jgi:hypothetical protein
VTAQTPDRLDYQGKTYSVYEFIDLPPGVLRPPDDVLVRSTACWRGFTVRWEVREEQGCPQLTMVGFQCDDYLPLCRPYCNPITGTVRVVPDDAELLNYEHMGFQSKHAGELRMKFIAGELVGTEPIPDIELPQDGLLDLAELGPGGKEGWLEETRHQTHGWQRRVPPADVQATLQCADDPVHKTMPCVACDRIVSEVARPVRDPLCADCVGRLLAIGRELSHWCAMPSKFGGGITLSSQPDCSDGPQVDPEWHARSGLYSSGSLGFHPGGSNVQVRIGGPITLLCRVTIDGVGDGKSREEQRRFVLSSVRRRLEDHVGDRSATRIRVSYERGIEVTITREITVAAETLRTGVPLAATEIASTLMERLDVAVERWRAERAELEKFIRREVPTLVSALVHDAAPSGVTELTSTDREILCWATRSEAGLAQQAWAVLPRHTPDGWLPGETVQERYLKSLNL